MEKHQVTALYTIPIETPIGLFYIITDSVTDTVLAAGFGTLCHVREHLPASLRALERAQHPDVPKWQKRIADYFSGNTTALKNIHTRSFGTSFQEQVWAALRSIPYGKTVTYKELAITIGSPSAVRAVGSACAKNPNILVTPCHRVVKSDGTIGEYAYGTKIKEYLLNLERKHTTSNF